MKRIAPWTGRSLTRSAKNYEEQLSKKSGVPSSVPLSSSLWREDPSRSQIDPVDPFDPLDPHTPER